MKYIVSSILVFSLLAGINVATAESNSEFCHSQCKDLSGGVKSYCYNDCMANEEGN